MLSLILLLQIIDTVYMWLEQWKHQRGNYSTIAEAFGGIIQQVNEMIANSIIDVDEVEHKIGVLPIFWLQNV